MKTDIRGAVAVVTGATGEFGSALSHELARRGVRLALVARGVERLAGVADQIEAAGGTAIAIPADVGDRDDRLGILEQTRRHLGPVDILVNNARIGGATHFVDEDPHHVVAANLLGPMALTREVIRDMSDRARGHVLTVASLDPMGLPYLVGLSASSAGLTAFSTSLSEELRGTGMSATLVTTAALPVGRASCGASPWLFRTLDAQAASRKAIAAMLRCRPVVTIDPVPMVPLRIAQAVSPRAVGSMMRALGVRAVLGAQARLQSDHVGTPLDRRRPSSAEDGPRSHLFDDASRQKP